MTLTVDGSTNRQLLVEVADWNNHRAWVNFREVYDPRLRQWCRRYRLDNDAIDEVCQRIWIELADRMKTFEYDPTRTFRGWLRRLCECRVLNFLREGRADSVVSLGERIDEPPGVASPGAIGPDEVDECNHRVHRLLLEQGEQAQAAVRATIKPQTWEAFWLVAVCDWSVARTAQTLGMTNTAVYAARDRVARMLRDQGNRMSDGGVSGS